MLFGSFMFSCNDRDEIQSGIQAGKLIDSLKTIFTFIMSRKSWWCEWVLNKLRYESEMVDSRLKIWHANKNDSFVNLSWWFWDLLTQSSSFKLPNLLFMGKSPKFDSRWKWFFCHDFLSLSAYPQDKTYLKMISIQSLFASFTYPYVLIWKKNIKKFFVC